jgi:hypothetical protein
MRALVLALALTACAVETGTEPVYSLDDAADAGYVAAVDAWEARFGLLPRSCRTARNAVSIAEVSKEEIEIDCRVYAKPGYMLLGCLLGDVILVTTRDDRWYQADTFAHEWIHLLARECDGSADGDHSRAELWDPTDGVAADAVARVTL